MSLSFAPLVLSLALGTPDNLPDRVGDTGAEVEVGGHEQAPEQEPSPRQGVAQILEDFAARETQPEDARENHSRTEFAALVRALGPAALGEIHALFGAQADTPSAPLDEREIEFLEAALRAFGKDAVASFCLELASEPELTWSQRTAGLALLAATGGRDQLEAALEVSGARGGDPLDPRLRGPLFEAVRALLQRDPNTSEAIPTLVLQLDPSAASALIRALGAAGGPDACNTLNAMLGADALLDRVSLTSIGEWARHHPGLAPQHLVDRIASYTGDDDSMVSRNALVALGALDAQGWHAELIEFLEHGDPAIACAAHGALMEITGLALPPDPVRWRMWLESEETWWKTKAEVLLDKLQGGILREQCAALQTLSRHRLHRHTIAERILPLLELESQELRGEACVALANLGAKLAVPPLQRLMADHDPDHPAHAAAARALALIQGDRAPDSSPTPHQVSEHQAAVSSGSN